MAGAEVTGFAVAPQLDADVTDAYLAVVAKAHGLRLAEASTIGFGRVLDENHRYFNGLRMDGGSVQKVGCEFSL